MFGGIRNERNLSDHLKNFFSGAARVTVERYPGLLRCQSVPFIAIEDNQIQPVVAHEIFEQLVSLDDFGHSVPWSGNDRQ